ncbi:phosphotransferase [Corynebacterium cystitidis]|uniref:phosphotransferase n=1 Tax=Corynebacterium cystitidis TaxID=35757 RepID=UPI00211E877A|nr:phosphotransferase [Corynebacterium cystitidis]
MNQEGSLEEWLRKQRFYRGNPKEDPQVRVIKKKPFLTGHHYFVDTVAGVYQFFLDDNGNDLTAETVEWMRQDAHGRIPLSDGATLHGELPKNFTIAPVANPTGRNLHYRMTDVDTGKHYMVRVFHYLTEGLSSEIDLLSQLTGAHFPKVEGYVTIELDGIDYTLSAIESYESGEPGSAIAKQSASAGFYHHTELINLGRTVRYMHDALAMAFPTGRRPTNFMGDALKDLFDELADDYPHLEEHRQRINHLVAAMPEDFPVQRIHGDLRLELTLLDNGVWVIVDFNESIPHPGAHELRSPTDDVAGIVASLREHGANNPVWCENVVDSFLEGYGLDKIDATFRACQARRGLLMLATAETEAQRVQGRRLLSLEG